MLPPRSKRLSANAAPGESNLVIRNVTVLGKRTSLRMEPQMWDALIDVCERERLTAHDVCSRIADRKEPEASLTGAIRVFLLSYFRHAATEEGHLRAGHGNGRLLNLDEVFADAQKQMQPRRGRAKAPAAGNSSATPA